MLRLRTATCLLSAGAALALAPSAQAASWKTNVNYGGASGATRTDFYVPDNVKSKPAVLFSIHYCSGQGANAHSWFQSYADQYGFIIIAPTAHGNCFDANLGRKGEQADFVLMIDYAITTYGADTDRVYAAGLSSGACMAQALAADYPDRFAAVSSLAGVPAGAWTGGNDYAWSTSGTSGAQAWGDKVRNADPGFTGPRPHVQIWHGKGDTTLTYSQTFPIELIQFPNVFGLTDADGMKMSIKPAGAKSTWDRTTFKDCSGDVVVEANDGPQSVTHDLGSENIWQDTIRFFDLPNGGLTKKACGGNTGGAGGMGGMGAGGAATAGAGGRGGGGAPPAGGTGNAGTGMTSGGAGPTGGSATAGGPTGGTANMTAGAGGTANGMGGTATGMGGTATGMGGTSTGMGGTATSMGGTGGTSTGTAGKPTGTGGSAGTGTAGTGGDTPGEDPAGCGCRVASQPNSGMSALLLVGGLALAGARRRRRERD
jgi:poly(hydroxyalkanoate) depolymerase family esterase